jgi:hypothetical protein
MVTATEPLQAVFKDARVHYPENKNHKPPPTPDTPPVQPAVTPATMTRKTSHWCGFRVISQNPNSVSKPIVLNPDTHLSQTQCFPLLTHL